jgi:hypothetical protein
MAFCSAQPAAIFPARNSPMPRHLPQILGRGFDDLEGPFAESSDYSLGQDRTDPTDHPGAEVFLDPLRRGGRRGLEESGLELKAMGSVRDPDAHGVYELPGRDRGHMADDRHEIALASRFHFQDREAIVLVAKRHALHRPDECLSGRRRVIRGFQEGDPID